LIYLLTTLNTNQL